MLSSSHHHPLAIILTQLRHQPMTALEIQATTSLSAPTTLRALKRLEDISLIQVVGKRESTGGRKAKTYGLNGKARLVVGVHLELPGLHLVLTDLVGNLVKTRFLSGDFDISPQDALRQISGFVHEMQLETGPRQIVGTGIAAPGYLDPSGTIISIGRDPSWENVPIRARLEQELRMPILIENDVDCMAQSEVELARSQAQSDFIYLGITEGVKASLILNGEFYRGPFGNAGTIGHTTVDPRGELCRCGNRGCLETVASVRAVCATFERRLRDLSTVAPQLIRVNQLTDHSAKFKAILDAAEAREPLCREIIITALDFLAQAIANLIDIFQVKLIIIGGSLSDLPPGLRAELDGQVRQRLVALLRNNLTLRYARDTRPFNAAFGAAVRMAQEYLTRHVELAEM